jgi:hypothetical protein
MVIVFGQTCATGSTVVCGGADNSSKMKTNDAIYACAHIAPRRIYSYRMIL